jgi:hypothetical protein
MVLGVHCSSNDRHVEQRQRTDHSDTLCADGWRFVNSWSQRLEPTEIQRLFFYVEVVEHSGHPSRGAAAGI